MGKLPENSKDIIANSRPPSEEEVLNAIAEICFDKWMGKKKKEKTTAKDKLKN